MSWLVLFLAVVGADAQCMLWAETGEVTVNDIKEEAWGGFGGEDCPRVHCDPSTQTLWLREQNEQDGNIVRDDMNKNNERVRRSYCMRVDRDGFWRFGRSEYKQRSASFAFKSRESGYWEEESAENQYDVCLDHCGKTCEELGEGDTEVFAALMAHDAPGQAPEVCYERRGESSFPWFTAGWIVIATFGLLFYFGPITLACCVSNKCCCLYDDLNKLRNNFADLFPRLDGIVQGCCVKAVSVCHACCCACKCCKREKAVAGSASRDEGEIEAVVVSQQPGVDSAADDEVDEKTGAISRKPATTRQQFKLITWQIFRTKSRDTSGLIKQVFFPALFFLALWFLYIIMGVSGFGNRWNKSNSNFKRKDGNTRSYERGQILSYGFLETFSAQIAFVSVMQNVIVSLVVEHHAKLLEAARMAGMRDSSYWIAHFVADGVVIGFVTALLVAIVAAPGLFRFAGHADSYAGPLAPFGILFLTHWLYIIALVAFCFAAAVVIPSAMIASLFSVVIQIAVIVVCFLCAPNSDGKLVSIFDVSPKVQTYWALIPQCAYWLIVQSFLSNRSRYCRIRATVSFDDESTPDQFFSSDKYLCDYSDDDDNAGQPIWQDAKRKYRDALFEFLDANGAMCVDVDDDSLLEDRIPADCDVQGPFSEFRSFYHGPKVATWWLWSIFGMLILDVFLYLALAWYLNQVVPWSEYGTPQKWYFIFTPKFWSECLCGTKDEDEPYLVEHEAGDENAASTLAVEPRSDDGEVVVTVENLHRTFGKTFKAVDGVSFDMARSEIFCLLGHNGAGKTTTIACLTGLISPDKRRDTSAHILGHNILTADGMHRLRATLGVCPQHDILYPMLTLKEHIVFFSQMKGKSKSAAERDADNLLAVFHLNDRAAHLGSELSGGQKRKLSTSIALAGSSRFIVLDEPTAGMDPVARRELWTLLRTVRRDRAMLLTTHHMDEAEVLGDRIGIMVAGKISANGSLAFLKRKFSPFLPVGAGSEAAAYRIQVFLDQGADEEDADKIVIGSGREGESATFAERAECEGELINSVPLSPTEGATVKYNVALSSDEDLKKISTVFEKLDASSGIQRYEVMTTTLEDVFLQVGKSAEIHNVAKDDEDKGMLEDFVRRSSRSLDIDEVEKQAHDSKRSARGPGADDKSCGAVMKQLGAIVTLRYRLNIRSVRAYATVLTPSLAITVIVICAKEGVLSSSEHWGELSNAIVALVVVGAYVVIPGLLAMPLVQERSLRLRNLLSISGCDARAFWGGTLVADASLVLVSVLIALVAFSASGMAYRKKEKNRTYHSFTYNPPNSTNPEDIVDADFDDDKEYTRKLWVEDEPWIWALLPMFGVALCAFSHIGSYGFHEAMACVGAFPIINIVGFIVFPLIVVITFALVFGNVLSGTEAIQLVNWDFFEIMSAFAWLASVVSPIGNLFAFMFRVANLSFIPTKSQNEELSPTWPYFWSCFVLLVVQLVVFEGFAYLKDRIETRPLRYVKSKFSKKRREALDVDVARERDRVLELLHKDEAVDDEDEDVDLLTGDKKKKSCAQKAKAMVQPLVEFVDRSRTALLNQLPESDHPPPFADDALEIPGLAVLELRKIFPPKRYGATAVEAVKNVTFSVASGECFGLLGSNGAGKTTTMSMTCRVLEPTSGDAKIAGVSTLTDFSRASTNLSVVNQMNTLWETLSCEDHVRLFAKLRLSSMTTDSRNEESIDAIVASTLVAVELDKHARKLAGRLSGGMKRKLCCACALVADPRVVMLDEPSAGLDPVSQRNLWNLIKRSMIGRSVVLTTHSLLEADVLCDRIAIMTYGQIKCLGTSSHLKTKYTSGYDLVLKLQDSVFNNSQDTKRQPGEEDGGDGSNAPPQDFEEAKERISNFVEDAFSEHESKPRLVATDADTITFELGGGGSGGVDGVLSKIFAAFDEETRKKLAIADFVVNPASMEKVFLNIVAESDDQHEQQLKAAKLGRRVADELDEDDEDIHKVDFTEEKCCGCSKFAHRVLCGYNCIYCCFCCVWSFLGIFATIVPYWSASIYITILSCFTCIQDIVGINLCFRRNEEL